MAWYNPVDWFGDGGGNSPQTGGFSFIDPSTWFDVDGTSNDSFVGPRLPQAPNVPARQIGATSNNPLEGIGSFITGLSQFVGQTTQAISSFGETGIADAIESTQNVVKNATNNSQSSFSVPVSHKLDPETKQLLIYGGIGVVILVVVSKVIK